MAAQIGADHREALGQLRRHEVPLDESLRPTVEQQDGRPLAAAHEVDLGTRGRDSQAVETVEHER